MALAGWRLIGAPNRGQRNRPVKMHQRGTIGATTGGGAGQAGTATGAGQHGAATGAVRTTAGAQQTRWQVEVVRQHPVVPNKAINPRQVSSFGVIMA